jgi:soluble lytic murein transglycosylase
LKKTARIIIWFVLLIFLALSLKSITKSIVQMIYPLKYEEHILKYSAENELNPYFVMAVIKAESNYNPSAHSGVARGLMQITDDTAVWIAQKLDIEFNEHDIENPELNIKMGCYYLHYLSDRYSDTAVVLASYNAGMGNVSKWLNDLRFSKDSKTLFNIPFEETRSYVEKVMKYKSIYKKLYHDKIKEDSV